MIDVFAICLALGLHFEARGEPLAGQLAVARVILHRTAHWRYPDDVCSVIEQPGQFSWVTDEIDLPEERLFWEYTLPLAFDILDGTVDLGDSPALHFHSGPPPYWTAEMVLVEVIGRHSFYQLP